MAGVYSIAREIPDGRMPTAAIPMSLKNYPVFLFWRDIASRCKRGALSIVFIFEYSVCTAGSAAEAVEEGV